MAAACNIVLGVDECKIDKFIDILRAKELAQAKNARLQKDKLAGKKIMIVEEDYDSDDNCPKSHMSLLEELTNLEECT